MSARFAFFLGVILVVAMPLGFLMGGHLIGWLFLPPLVGAYGLFLSSGAQLYELDENLYGSLNPPSATHLIEKIE